jgi:hypothetical protein
MIASALGNKPEAAQHLERALALNPRFDPRQSEIAASALRALQTP